MENTSFFCEMLEKHLQLLTEKASVKGLSCENICMITDQMRDLARLYKEICLIEKLESPKTVGELATEKDTSMFLTPQEFRLAVKHRLVELNKPQSWLCREYTKRTGKYCDASYLKRLYDGTIHPAEPIRVIKEILDLPQE